MRKCKEIVLLTTTDSERRLTWYVNLEFKLHLMMCTNCHRYVQQLHIVQRMLDDERAYSGVDSDKTMLSEQAKQRMAESLKKVTTD